MLRIIGDVHQDYQAYSRLLKHPSIQIGDMGFDYSFLDGVSEEHRYFPGNHDNPIPHARCLGRYGYLEQYGIYFIGGGHSIDRRFRTMGVDLFPNEELSLQEMRDCIADCAIKGIKEGVSIVLSHECPDFLSNVVSNPSILEHYGYARNWTSMTSKFLGDVYAILKPKLWVFGHHHKQWEFTYDGCKFVCLNMVGKEGGYIDVDC